MAKIQKCPFCGKEMSAGLHVHIKYCEKNPDGLERKPRKKPSENKYKCQYCGRKLSTPVTLATHEKYCAKNPANKETIEVAPGVVELTNDQKIIDFFDALGGRTVANKYDIGCMHKMFNALYPNAKLEVNYDCTSCVSHIYNKLKQHYQKIKK